jgi:hypothetical protein
MVHGAVTGANSVFRHFYFGAVSGFRRTLSVWRKAAPTIALSLVLRGHLLIASDVRHVRHLLVRRSKSRLAYVLSRQINRAHQVFAVSRNEFVGASLGWVFRHAILDADV